MATAESLLATSFDDSDYLVIDADTRAITIPSGYSLLGVESDEKVRRIPFKCPRYVSNNDIDLTECSVYINYVNANNEENKYIVTDVTDNGDDTVIFTWELSRHVTAKQGTVRYLVCARKLDGSDIVNEFNSQIATGTVAAGLETDGAVEEEYQTDAIQQIINSGGYDDTQIKNDLAELQNSKVGYAEYTNNHLYLYDTENGNLIADLTIEGGSSSGGISETKCKEIIESYGYAVASDFYSKTEIDTKLSAKQDTISDLATIRSGASKGATALQSVPSTYRTASEQDAIHDSTKQDILTDSDKQAIADLHADPTVAQILTDGTEIAKIGDTSLFAPSGGSSSGEEWEQLIDQTIDTASTQVTFTVGDNGQTLSDYKKLLIFGFITVVSDNTNTNFLKITFSGSTPWSKYGHVFSSSVVKDGSGGAVGKLALFENINGNIIQHWAAESLNSTNMRDSIKPFMSNTVHTYLNTENSTSDNTNTLSEPIFYDTTFEKINIGAYFTCLGIGSRFIIWGIK